MKLANAITPTVSLLAVVVTAARECPEESDCMERLCTNFGSMNAVKYKHGAGGTGITLVARCKDDAGKEWNTSLDLRNCIANYDGYLAWADAGNQNCEGCSIKHEAADKPVILKCDFCARKNAFWRGYMWSWLNLSYGIWVKNGALGCFSHEGTKVEPS